MSKPIKPITVAELKKILNAYPGALPVIARWEGLHVELLRDCISVEEVPAGKVGHFYEALILDVDQH